MVESRQRAEWWHTATVLAMIHNTFAKGKKWTAADCHPMENQKPKVVLKGKQLSILKDIFCQEQSKIEKEVSAMGCGDKKKK